MDWIRIINNAITYMEHHLTEEVTLADIAKNGNVSAFHFQRVFSLLTGMTPAEYTRKRRLSQAGAEIARFFSDAGQKRQSHSVSEPVYCQNHN